MKKSSYNMKTGISANREIPVLYLFFSRYDDSVYIQLLYKK